MKNPLCAPRRGFFSGLLFYARSVATVARSSSPSRKGSAIAELYVVRTFWTSWKRIYWTLHKIVTRVSAVKRSKSVAGPKPIVTRNSRPTLSMLTATVWTRRREFSKASNQLSYYQSLPELAEFGPTFRGAAHHGDWHLLLLDHVERAMEVPPWTERAFRSAVAALARFHANTPARARSILPIAEAQSEFMGLYRAENGWRLLMESAARAQFLALFENEADARRWLDAHLEEFIDLEAQAAALGGPRSWVHHDVRSDNLLFTTAPEPLLVDFPFLAFGPTLMDVAFFLPSVAGEGGPSPMEGLRIYEQARGHEFDGRDTAIAVATVAGFFAVRAGLPDIPGLPRLRWVQKLQLVPSLGWLSAMTGIAPPPPLKPFHT
jgi:hypothetical protein